MEYESGENQFQSDAQATRAEAVTVLLRLLNQGMDEKAVEHYIKGRQAEEAVRIIERIFPDYLQLKSTVMMRWITALPESCYRDKPMLEMFYITKLVGDGEWEKSILRIEQAEIRFEALRRAMPEPAWKQVMGNLYYFCGILSYLQQNLTRASHYFELVESYLPEGSSFQHMQSKRYQGYDHFTDLLSLNNDLVVVEQFLQEKNSATGFDDDKSLRKRFDGPTKNREGLMLRVFFLFNAGSFIILLFVRIILTLAIDD